MTEISTDTQSSQDEHLGRLLAEGRLNFVDTLSSIVQFTSWSILSQLLTNVNGVCPSVGQVVERVLNSVCRVSNDQDVDTVYKLSTNRLATVPPSRSMSLVSELEQISPITKSRSSPEIPNI